MLVDRSERDTVTCTQKKTHAWTFRSSQNQSFYYVSCCVKTTLSCQETPAGEEKYSANWVWMENASLKEMLLPSREPDTCRYPDRVHGPNDDTRHNCLIWSEWGLTQWPCDEHLYIPVWIIFGYMYWRVPAHYQTWCSWQVMSKFDGFMSSVST